MKKKTPRCHVKDCEKEWESLARLGAPRTREKLLGQCQPCGRTACGIHSVAAMTTFFGSKERRQVITVQPAMCNDCARVALRPHELQGKRRVRT